MVLMADLAMQRLESTSLVTLLEVFQEVVGATSRLSGLSNTAHIEPYQLIIL